MEYQSNSRPKVSRAIIRSPHAADKPKALAAFLAPYVDLSRCSAVKVSELPFEWTAEYDLRERIKFVIRLWKNVDLIHDSRHGEQILPVFAGAVRVRHSSDASGYPVRLVELVAELLHYGFKLLVTDLRWNIVGPLRFQFGRGCGNLIRRIGIVFPHANDALSCVEHLSCEEKQIDHIHSRQRVFRLRKVEQIKRVKAIPAHSGEVA